MYFLLEFNGGPPETYRSKVLESWDAAEDSDVEREKAKKAAEIKGTKDRREEGGQYA